MTCNALWCLLWLLTFYAMLDYRRRWVASMKREFSTYEAINREPPRVRMVGDDPIVAFRIDKLVGEFVDKDCGDSECPIHGEAVKARRAAKETAN